jgi:heparan sulfate 6-O-sulfotransferase HS6ST1
MLQWYTFYLSCQRVHSLIFFTFLFVTGENWIGVKLDKFVDCESNLATNRQTRMLADLALVNCYNKTSMPSEERNRMLLTSAKRNLAGKKELKNQRIEFQIFLLLTFSNIAMSFFGLTEYQKISQYIFEETFNLRFAIPFEQHNSTLSMQMYENLTTQQKDDVNNANALDLELYNFAKKLMFQR